MAECAPAKSSIVGSTSHFITENITAYMKEIEKIPRITVAREAELYALMHGDDEKRSNEAREELICSNLRLVVKIAHDFKRFGMTFADIVAEGNCGLMLAADKFIPSKGSRFSCYASWWIKQSIRKALANQTRTIRIPGSSAQKLIKMQHAEDKFFKEHGELPTDAQLTEMTGLGMKALANLHRADIRTYSLDDQVKDDGTTTFGDMMSEEIDEDSVKKEADNKALDHVRQLLSHFKTRDQFILNHAYGLDGVLLDERVICQETGLPASILQQRIRRIIARLQRLTSSDGVPV